MIRSEITSHQPRILEDYGFTSNELIDVSVFEYAEGEFICKEEQPIDQLLFLYEGNAKVCCNMENGKSLLLCFYHSGGLIGDLELMIDCHTAKTSVQAISRVKCVSVPVKLNQAALHSNIRFLNNVGSALARKLERCSKNSSFIILYPLETRLCSYIEAMCKDGSFRDNLTEIAELLGISYRHLLRSLQNLCADGVLEKGKTGYRIKDYAALHRLARNFYEPVNPNSHFWTQ